MSDTKPTIEGQKLYEDESGNLRAEIDLILTHEDEHAPSIQECRHAVLQIQNGSKPEAYVVYDRLLCRIVNGVYYMPLKDVLESAQSYNEHPELAWQDMSPNGAALGLKYPHK